MSPRNVQVTIIGDPHALHRALEYRLLNRILRYFNKRRA